MTTHPPTNKHLIFVVASFWETHILSVLPQKSSDSLVSQNSSASLVANIGTM